MNMLHSPRVEVSAGQVKLWIDRTPLGTVALPGLALPSHVGLATNAMLGVGEGGQFDDVVVEGMPVAPQFDRGPKPEQNWIMTNSSDRSLMGTDSIGNAIVLADGSILALNTALYRSVDEGKSWAMLSLFATQRVDRRRRGVGRSVPGAWMGVGRSVGPVAAQRRGLLQIPSRCRCSVAADRQCASRAKTFKTSHSQAGRLSTCS
jgi:hypothetical protein